ncbi:hypothetical protein CBS101457_000177 [Exobasidium rhododendri]|nr:hypothetical protein CBS101457_000177 [Exobasidium rhododendri]
MPFHYTTPDLVGQHPFDNFQGFSTYDGASAIPQHLHPSTSYAATYTKPDVDLWRNSYEFNEYPLPYGLPMPDVSFSSPPRLFYGEQDLLAHDTGRQQPSSIFQHGNPSMDQAGHTSSSSQRNEQKEGRTRNSHEMEASTSYLEPRDHRHEYKLQYNPRFNYRSEDDLVWKNDILSDDQKAVIVENIQRVRPDQSSYIRKQMGRNLTPVLAKGLLSKDEHCVEETIQTMYPIDYTRQKSSHEKWMKGLKSEDRIEVIRIMAEATEQSADALRDVFLRNKLTPEVASVILHADADVCRMIAEKYGLYIDGRNSYLAWQRGMSAIQKRALIQRMMVTGKFKTEKSCYEFLGKNKVPFGYGIKLLRASNEELLQMADSLRGRGPVWL